LDKKELVVLKSVFPAHKEGWFEPLLVRSAMEAEWFQWLQVVMEREILQLGADKEE
jgi:hypothetical protein